MTLSLFTSLPTEFKCKQLYRAEENYCSHSHQLQLHASKEDDRKQYEVWSKSNIPHSLKSLIVMTQI